MEMVREGKRKKKKRKKRPQKKANKSIKAILLKCHGCRKRPGRRRGSRRSRASPGKRRVIQFLIDNINTSRAASNLTKMLDQARDKIR
jgi:hypothetical protein